MDSTHGYPIPSRGYQDPYREPTKAQVSFYNEALNERRRNSKSPLLEKYLRQISLENHQGAFAQ